VVQAALRLAIMFKVDPFSILERPPHMVFEMLNRTSRIFEEMARDQDE